MAQLCASAEDVIRRIRKPDLRGGYVDQRTCLCEHRGQVGHGAAGRQRGGRRRAHQVSTAAPAGSDPALQQPR